MLCWSGAREDGGVDVCEHGGKESKRASSGQFEDGRSVELEGNRRGNYNVLCQSVICVTSSTLHKQHSVGLYSNMLNAYYLSK